MRINAIISSLLVLVGFACARTLVTEALACDAPMPRDVKIQPPPVSLPPSEARFVGIWNGEWAGTTCASIAVKEIDQTGNAKIVLATDAFQIRGQQFPPTVFELPGHVENDTLKFVSPRGVQYSFAPDGDKLAGTSSQPSGTVYHGVFAKQ
jgi:hypothetical protein